MALDGYIKLWRKTLNSAVWENHSLFRFWMWCLMKATYQERIQVVGFQEVKLQPGEFVFGRYKAAEETGISERTIRTCLKSLTTMGNVTIKVTNKFSIISIINWDSYQSNKTQNDQQNDQQVTSNRPASDQQVTTNKKEKKVKKDKKERVSTALPENFELNEARKRFAIDTGIYFDNVKNVFEKFCDYWRGRDKKWVDWDAVWRNWVRNEIEFSKKNGGNSSKNTKIKFNDPNSPEEKARLGF